MIYIVAGNFKEASLCATYVPRQQWIYIPNPLRVRGWRWRPAEDNIVYTGTWEDRQDRNELIPALVAAGFPPPPIDRGRLVELSLPEIHISLNKILGQTQTLIP